MGFFDKQTDGQTENYISDYGGIESCCDKGISSVVLFTIMKIVLVLILIINNAHFALSDNTFKPHATFNHINLIAKC